MTDSVKNSEAPNVDQEGAPREHIDKLTPPPGTSFWRHQRFTLFEDEPIGTWRTVLAVFTWRIDAYIYVVDAVPNSSFASNGGSIYVVMVNSGSAKTGANLEPGGWPYTPMQYRFGVRVAGSEGAALMQLPPSNSGTKDGDTWKYTAAFSKDLQMFQNNGAQAFTFSAKYSDDINFYKGEQTGDVNGHNSVQWSSILTDYYDNLSKSISFPFSSLNCFQFDSLKRHDLVCTINANKEHSLEPDNPQLVRTATITLNCEFSAPDDPQSRA